MNDALFQLGVGGALAVILVGMVLNFLRARSSLPEVMGELVSMLKTIHVEVHELHQMHDQKDMDGVPLWYVPRSWGDIHKSIVSTQRDIAEVQRDILKILERLERDYAP